MSKTFLCVGLLLLGLLAVACGGQQATVVGIEQSGSADTGSGTPTEIIKFDPASIATGDTQPVDGECTPSAAVPGAFRCTTPDVDRLEPCFVRQDGLLLCEPNPAQSAYRALVSATNQLTAAAAPDDTPFSLELDTGSPPCGLYMGPPLSAPGGHPIRYVCGVPGLYGFGLETGTTPWQANLIVIDPATDEQASVQPVDVLRAWTP